MHQAFRVSSLRDFDHPGVPMKSGRVPRTRSGARYRRRLFYLSYVVFGLGALLVIAHRSVASTTVGAVLLVGGLVVGRRARV